MADNTLLNSGTGGNTIRTLEDGSSIHWPVGVVAYATTVGSPDVLSIPTAAALADNTSNPTTLLTGSCALWYDGSTWDLARGDATNGLLVNLGSNNDVTLATLPDTAAGDLAAMRASLGGTLTVGSHNVTNAGTFAVQVSSALPAGTNAIGKLAANSGVDIGDVDVTSVIPGTGATNLGKAVDSAAGSTDTGVAQLAVRDDALSALTPIEGDYVPLRTDANGALWVIHSGAISAAQSGTWTVQPGNTANTTAWLVTGTGGTFPATQSGTWSVRAQDGSGNALTSATRGSERALSVQIVDGSGTQITTFGGGTQYTEGDTDASITGTAVLWEDTSNTLSTISASKPLPVNIISGAGSGGTAIQDDTAYTVATTNLTPVGGTYRSTLDAVDDGDAGAFAMTANRACHVYLVDSNGDNVAVGGGTQYDEDAAHSTGSKVTGCGVVRQDTAASLCGTDGDYTLPIVDATGRLWVHVGAVDGTVTVGLPTGASTSANQTTIIGHLDGVEGLLTTIDADTGTLAGCVGGTELQVDIVGALPAGTNAIGKLAANSGVDIGDVDVTSVIPGTGATNLGKAVDSAAGGTDTGVASLAVRDDALAALTPVEGDYVPLRTDANGALWTIHSGNITEASAATIATNTGNSATSLAVIDDWDNAASDGASVSGDVAHDAADAGEPVKLGAKATTSVGGLTLVADGDRTNIFSGVDGVLITRPYCNLEDIVTATPVAITDGSSTSVISAQGAGVKVYIVEVIIANSSATNVTVDLRDGTAGAVKATFPVPANGGVVKTCAVPLPFSANTAIAADPSAAATTITVTLIGFKSKV